MKKLVLSLLAVGAMGLYSCVDDPCKDSNCALSGHGQCDEISGACLCDDGYEEDANGDCATLETAKFMGLWATNEDCANSAPNSYNITITPTGLPAAKTILIANMWDQFVAPVTATVNGTSFTIANQEPDGDGFTISGSGTLNGTTLTITYTVVGSTGTDVCTGTVFTKI